MIVLSEIGNKIRNLRSPTFDWIQVEISSLCNAQCIYCPLTIYSNDWHGSLMPLDTFRKLEPSLKSTKLVFLQGWGEPFLNPDFFEMVKISKGAGCQVGTTTNGILMDELKTRLILESGLDIIAFSVAGGVESNDEIRKGCKITRIMNAIKSISLLKDKKNSATPKIHIAYMMLKPYLQDLENIPDLFGELGIDQVVISTLDFIAGRIMSSMEVVAIDEAELKDIHGLMERVKAKGQQKGLPINYYLPSIGREHSICTENPLHSVFVGADGTVSPCVYTNLPVSNVQCLTPEGPKGYRRLTFGNLSDEPLGLIWRKKDYRRFRKSFFQGELFDSCRECKKLKMTMK